MRGLNLSLDFHLSLYSLYKKIERFKPLVVDYGYCPPVSLVDCSASPSTAGGSSSTVLVGGSASPSTAGGSSSTVLVGGSASPSTAGGSSSTVIPPVLFPPVPLPVEGVITIPSILSDAV